MKVMTVEFAIWQAVTGVHLDAPRQFMRNLQQAPAFTDKRLAGETNCTIPPPTSLASMLEKALVATGEIFGEAFFAAASARKPRQHYTWRRAQQDVCIQKRWYQMVNLKADKAMIVPCA